MGAFKTTYRARPAIKPNYPVHIVIPFKDEKKHTINAVRSAFAQKGVKVYITAVDNRSEDRSIAEELTQMGVEVLFIDEAFNFSRLNNLAVKMSRFSALTEATLFLNNDVELQEDALEEMCRWIDQPKVGIVGARLFYPDKTIQHGGVVLNTESRNTNDPRCMRWEHVDCRASEHSSTMSRTINVFDAVTGACLLIRNDTFAKVGGFDEIWYPIAFSDTDLAVRVRRLGLYALYTPYASGIHYESLSRGPGSYEQPEASYWMFRTTSQRETPQERLKNHVFFN